MPLIRNSQYPGLTSHGLREENAISSSRLRPTSFSFKWFDRHRFSLEECPTLFIGCGLAFKSWDKTSKIFDNKSYYGQKYDTFGGFQKVSREWVLANPIQAVLWSSHQHEVKTCQICCLIFPAIKQPQLPTSCGLSLDIIHTHSLS